MSRSAKTSTTFAHERVLASAGSGKTYQLTSRYLALLAAGAAPGSILATTFTRLAAGEIRDRVLGDLAAACIDESDREKLATRIGGTSISRDRALTMLRTMAGNLHRLQIRTLDSFFASLTTAFGLELGLPPGAEVIEPAADATLRAEAIRRMLDESEPQALIDLLRKLTRGQESRRVTAAIDDTVSKLHELHREAALEAWDHLRPPEPLPPPALMTAIQRLEDLPLEKKSLVNARSQDVERARAHDWLEFISKGIGAKVADGSDKFGRVALNELTVRAYQPLVQHARAVLIGRLHGQNLATRELLAHYGEQYTRLKRESHAITFDDLTDAAGRLMQTDSFDLIGFRLDATLHHLLLDEMQDTSIGQWRALQPLAREIISVAPPDRTFFCVGDVKQSIYGFRDAAPEVLEEIPDLLRGFDGRSAIATRTLSESWRSSPIVIDAVNRIFSGLSHNEALRDWPEIARQWDTSFEMHQTTKSKQHLHGYVELRTIPRLPVGVDKKIHRLRCAADRIDSLHRLSPTRTIAVLTRTNAAVARLLYELGPAQRNLPIGARGGGPLTDAAPVNAVLDLMRMADHPDDTICAYNVATGPLGAAIGLSNYEDRGARHRTSRTVRRSLLHRGYAETIAGWIAKLASQCDERELRRLTQLVTLAHEHDAEPSLRADDFVRAVEKRDVADDRPAPIQVMTIHQAKGLEFDIVVLAELEEKLSGGNSPVVVERDGPTGPITRICRYASSEIRAIVPEIEPIFEAHRARAVRESLNLLYVAATRAKHALHILIEPPVESERSHPKTLAGVLRGSLLDEIPEPDFVFFSVGDERWWKREEAADDVSHATPPPLPDRIELRPSRGEAWRGAATRSPAGTTTGATLADLLRPVDAAARARGAAMHLLFEQIEWLEDFAASDAELNAVVAAAFPRPGEHWAEDIVHTFRRSLEHEPISEALSLRGRDRNSIRVLRERPYLRAAESAIERGVIDRLELEFENESIQIATVIDFKTDRIDASQVTAQAEHYRPQMTAYRRAVADRYCLDTKSIHCTLLFVEPGLAAQLNPQP